MTTRETGIGSDDPIALYHELGGSRAGRPAQRSFLAASARQYDVVLFRLYEREYRLKLPL